MAQSGYQFITPSSWLDPEKTFQLEIPYLDIDIDQFLEISRTKLPEWIDIDALLDFLYARRHTEEGSELVTPLWRGQRICWLILYPFRTMRRFRSGDG